MKIYLNIFVLLLACFNAGAQQTTPKGAAYTILTQNTGEKIKLGDVVTFNIEQRTDKDSVLFSTYATQPVKAQIKPSQMVMDLMEIFPLLTINDSATVKIPVDSIFKGADDRRPPFLAKGGQILTTLKILNVQSLADAMAERNAQLEKIKAAELADAGRYITEKKLNLLTKSSGLKYQITQPSAKRKPQNGDTVLVNYVGQTLSGKVFDSSIEEEAKRAGLNQPGRKYEPIEVVLGEGRVIKGWEEALLLLGEGAKAKLLIPSQLGYGERGAGADIKPFSTLVFDVELVKVKPGKKAAAAPVKASAKKTVTKKKAVTRKTLPAKKKN
ncbi:peptidylprolyl isomerase [Mucilaginibacter hurinus]|uniref:peptidylprolyl isomerase n=1 Tax=Mucilaginibacter hurinus TaxID=2201324 RepID=A0A367GQZ1_9SPHI|nr:FKBP-type peptidyl-prolyl cis-trans isomerase [Mucilaginibacter hurinus]RCH55495.1 peptidylprolyl isomerase [Mucilaginibacter hurinus]